MKFCMRKQIKQVLWIIALACSLQYARGFALLGPRTDMAGLPANYGDQWQTPTIAYDLPGDVGTPKNLGEEYRRNTPKMYYTYDQNFLDFFGSNGVAAVDQAMAIMNSLTNVDSYSPALTEFPLEAQGFNYEAQSAGLTDLKSVALYAMMEQMGLAEPERYIWTLHDRYLPSGGHCPDDELYLVVQRNYDFETSPLNQIQYSSYVNDTLYTYDIFEHCSGPDPLAGTTPIGVDPYADTYTAVAGLGDGLGAFVANNPYAYGWTTFEAGGFYTGLTRDDLAGLRYLLSTNNVNYESPAAGSALENTNFNSQQLLMTFNLGQLLAEAKTNDPGTLATNFPGLIVSSSSNYFTVGVVTNITAYFTNYVGGTYGVPPTLVFATNYVPVPMTNYVDTFANVVIVSSNANTTATLQTIVTTNYNGGTYGVPPVTNVTSQTIVEGGVPSGDFFIIPPGTCGYDIGYALTNPITGSTNFVTAITNALTSASTNVTTGTTNLGLSATVNLITYFTNHWLVVYPCALQQTNDSGLYQGIARVQFVRADYDSLVGQYFQPITNFYTMTYITNSQAITRNFQRVVTQPDILFSADDLTSPERAAEIGPLLFARNVNFNIGNILPNLAGPGTIDPSTTISFNKVGDIYGNGSLAENALATNAFLSGYTQIGLLAWGSFDASTNDPVVYPNGTSIQNLENQILAQISPATVPDGTNGVTYPAQSFAITGGAFTPPFDWSAAAVTSSPTNNTPGSGLPLGLTVSSDGTLSGMPTNNIVGTYDFTMRLTDANSRSVTWNYSITIH
jgi:Putative Ig domain